MDLIAALSSQLGIDADKAQGLAGAALGLLQQQVSQKLGGADGAALSSQIPELAQWKAKAEASSAGGAVGGGLLGGAGGLLGAARSLLGGGGGGFDVAALVQLAAKAGVGPAAARQLLPLLLQFLQSRLDPALLGKISAAARSTWARTGKLTLSVRVSDSAVLSAKATAKLRGAKKASTVASATGGRASAGTVKLKLTLSSTARSSLKRSGKLTVKLAVSCSDTKTIKHATVVLRKTKTTKKAAR